MPGQTMRARPDREGSVLELSKVAAADAAVVDGDLDHAGAELSLELHFLEPNISPAVPSQRFHRLILPTARTVGEEGTQALGVCLVTQLS
jgi:hypothetical protein